MQKNINDLKREHEHAVEVEQSLHTNPIKREIQNLFENEFSGEKYKSYTLTSARELVVTRLQSSAGSGVHKAVAAKLSRKAANMKSMEDLLMMLNEYLFS